MTKVHRRDVKKIPMTDKVSQIYEEEQVNKTRNGRKIVPDNKMPNLQWNLDKQETVHKEEIQEIRQTPSRVLEAMIYIIILIYNSILSIQHTVTHRVNSTIEIAHSLVTTIGDISRTSWTRFQKEMQAKREHLQMQRENQKNQSYRSRSTFSERTTTQ